MLHTLIDPVLLLEITRRKVNINELVEALDSRGVWSDNDEEAHLLAWKKGEVRRAIRSIKGPDGEPLIYSIAEVGTDGREYRVYKQELLFGIEDYKQAIEYCRQNKRHWSKEEKRLLKNAREKFGDKATLF